MKKISKISRTCFIIALLLCGCGQSADISNIKIDYGQSTIYSEQDMNSAIDEILKEFRGWDDCTLKSLSYTSDEVSMNEIDYCNTFRQNADFDECMIFMSAFHSQKNGSSSGLSPDADYTDWKWILARKDNGAWELLTWGFA